MVSLKHQPVVDLKCWESLRKLAPCEAACPVTMDVPGYINAIAQGKFKEAMAIARESIPFPAVCGYVCHHPCEEECIRAKVEEPIAIRGLKRFAADEELKIGLEKPAPVEKTREKVAIVGSGPAGVAAAYDLARQGYDVTVFEASAVVGGMLAVGIPEFVLPREVVRNEIEFIEALGVEIKTNATFGKDLTRDDLWQQGYKAMFLAIGAGESVKLDIPGIDLEGIIYALPFMEDVNLGKEVKPGAKVMVIGGGNVGIDSARAALRLGAEVSLACLESRGEIPAFKWQIQRAEEEGVNIFPSLAPQRIVAKDGKIAGVNFLPVKSIGFDELGRIKPILAKGKQQFMEADGIIVAIGQSPSLSPILAGAKGLEVSKRGTIAVDPDTMATNLPGVFAGGEATAFPGTVIEAMAAGKKAARAIDRYLRGVELKEAEVLETLEVAEQKIPKFVEQRKRQEMPLLPVKERARSFKGVELGFSQGAAVDEAKRCVLCFPCGNCISERSQMCYQRATALL